jgi:cell division protein FtsB
MKGPLRTVLGTMALILAAGCIVFTLLGPNGIPMVLEKRRQIRELQEQNADLQRDIEVKKERIQGLSENRSQQELEVRKQLKLLKKDETIFVLQDQKK